MQFGSSVQNWTHALKEPAYTVREMSIRNEISYWFREERRREQHFLPRVIFYAGVAIFLALTIAVAFADRALNYTTLSLQIGGKLATSSQPGLAPSLHGS